MKRIAILLVLLFFFISATPATAHPGLLDKRGGHYCWTNCTKWGFQKGKWHKHQDMSKKAKHTSKIKAKTKVK